MIFPLPRYSGERVASACEPGEGLLNYGESPSPDLIRFAHAVDLSPQAGRGEEGASTKKRETYTAAGAPGCFNGCALANASSFMQVSTIRRTVG